MDKNEKSVVLRALKIIGILVILISIASLILTVIRIDDFSTNDYQIFAIASCVGMGIGAACLAFGFAPQITKITTNNEQTKTNESSKNTK